MAQLAIQGHATRGKEVIELLEMLGGKNTFRITDTCADCYYRISGGDIYGEQMLTNSNTTKVFSLEEFLEKFPFKIGDKVLYKRYNVYSSIRYMAWNEEEEQVIYRLDSQKIWVATANEIVRRKLNLI